MVSSIVVGPDLIKPSEWLPVVWGGESPEFSDDAQATTILGAVLGRYNEIAQSLAKMPPEIDPIFWKTDGGLVVAGDWAEGFLDAMDLRSREWAEMIEDEKESRPLIPILGLAGSENESPDLAGGSEKLARLRADATDMIPSCIFKIDAYWKSRRRPGTTTPLRARKPGRNDRVHVAAGGSTSVAAALTDLIPADRHDPDLTARSEQAPRHSTARAFRQRHSRRSCPTGRARGAFRRRTNAGRTQR